jgi:hypothetical protein
MREKRRKIPLDVILATPVSEARRKHGMQVYAARLCHRGQYDKAKEYCVKNHLPWPPFTGVPISTGEVLAKLVEQPCSDGVREAGPVVREEATPQEVAIIGETAPSEHIGAGGGCGAAGEPQTGECNALEPHESPPPAQRRARVWAFCVNPKLVRIRFEDGDKELASMWLTRGGFRLNEIIEVVKERGEGPNAIWEEKRRSV